MLVDWEKISFLITPETVKKCVRSWIRSWTLSSSKFQTWPLGQPQRRPNSRTSNAGNAVWTAGGSWETAVFIWNKSGHRKWIHMNSFWHYKALGHYFFQILCLAGYSPCFSSCCWRCKTAVVSCYWSRLVLAVVPNQWEMANFDLPLLWYHLTNFWWNLKCRNTLKTTPAKFHFDLMA